MDHAVSVSASIDVAASPAPPPRPAWTMPKPTLGTVLWSHQDGTGGQRYALVTAVYPTMIDCRVVTNDGWLPRAGVKHVSDPSLKKLPGSAPHGVWDFCPGELHLVAVIREATALNAKMAKALHDATADKSPAPADDATPYEDCDEEEVAPFPDDE